MGSSEKLVKELLKLADIHIDGPRPQDIKIHDKRFYTRVIKDQMLGIGESYMDGWWDCDAVDELFAQIIGAKLEEKVKLRPSMVLAGLEATVRNRQTVTKAKHNAEHHYNIGNELYEKMLDKRMIYSCGYWKGAKNLDQAQEQKLDLICQKLHLKKGMTLLEIGCGWGGFAEYATRKYGVRVTGVSPAGEQVKLARERTKGLDVTILECDYRDITGNYDRIVSIGMLEHVGHKNYKYFFEKCNELLNDDGMMLHHLIGGNRDSKHADAWVDKYIFPGGAIPSFNQLNHAFAPYFLFEDVQNIGPDYDKTLMAWHANFVREYPKLQDSYDERFYRMWSFYLLMCAGSFRQRDMQLWQIVMRKINRSETYVGVR